MGFLAKEATAEPFWNREARYVAHFQTHFAGLDNFLVYPNFERVSTRITNWNKTRWQAPNFCWFLPARKRENLKCGLIFFFENLGATLSRPFRRVIFFISLFQFFFSLHWPKFGAKTHSLKKKRDKPIFQKGCADFGLAAPTAKSNFSKALQTVQSW